MDRALRSLTLPNRQWDRYTSEELAAVLDLGPDGLVALGFSDNGSQHIRIRQEHTIWETLGRPPFFLRAYAEGIPTFDPTEWAMACARLVDQYTEYGIELAGLVGWNEPNIEGLEGDDWTALVAWENVFAGEWVILMPNVPLHRPALAPVGSYRLGYETRAGMGSPRFVVEDCHIYTEAQMADMEYLHHLFPDKLIAVTEWNFASWQGGPPTVPNFLRSLPDYVSMAVYFTSRWIDPPEGSPQVDLIGGPLYEDFKASKGITLPQPLPAIGEAVVATNNTLGGTEMTNQEAWAQLTAPYETFPALTKAIVGRGGITIGPEVVIDKWTFQAGILPSSTGIPTVVVAHAVTGDWERIAVAPGEDYLPF